MTKVLVNLTLPVVTEAIDSILESYPRHPYRTLFASYDSRQDLVAYVLNRFPSTYTVMGEGQHSQVSLETPHCNTEQRLTLETLVHQAIQYVSHEQGCGSRPQPTCTSREEAGQSCLPSGWLS